MCIWISESLYSFANTHLLFFHYNIRNSLWNYSSWKFHLLCSLISKMTYKYEALPKQIKLNVLHVLIRIHVLNLSEKIHLFLLSFKQSFCWHLWCVLVVTCCNCRSCNWLFCMYDVRSWKNQIYWCQHNQRTQCSLICKNYW